MDRFSSRWGIEKPIEICEKETGSRLSYLLPSVCVTAITGSQEYGWKFPATTQCQSPVTAGPSSTKNAGTPWRIEKKCESTSLGWILML